MIRNSPIYLTIRAHDNYAILFARSQPLFRRVLPFISTGSNRNRYAASQLKKKKKGPRRSTEARPEGRDDSQNEKKDKLDTAPVFRDVAKGGGSDLSYR